jgi:hypothetical protein
MPLILFSEFNYLKRNGGLYQAAVEGCFCRKPAVFAGTGQLAEAPSGVNFRATPFMQ